MTTVLGEQAALVITTMDAAKDAYRQKDLRQALYDAGEVVMAGVLVNLHGEEHRSRRRLENRLFRRDTLAHFERDLFPAVIDETLAPHVAAGRAELVSLGHQLMMNLAALNAGVDRQEGTAAETHRLYGYMMKFIEGATLAHATGDRARISDEIRAALDAFEAEFLAPSIARRAAALEQVARGELAEEALPRDVLTILLRHRDELGLTPDTLAREIAFFLLAGAHTSATAFTRALHHLFEWAKRHPEDAEAVRSDRLFVQRCVHETVRLHPSSPIGARRALEDVVLQDGTVLPRGALVVIDLVAVNRDPAVYGPDAAEFNPRRPLADGVAPYGLSFGHGMHACIGQELAAGFVSEDTGADHLYGLVTEAVMAAFERNVRPDPANPPVVDSRTARPYWASYPVLLGG
ncbi:MAG TPA: cytochrome P450 [Acidimicrobiales bacterium]|nr:cytochrome P450 [Acidimicrobiales bacterium]